MPQQWDEHGNPIPKSQQRWDENGKPVPPFDIRTGRGMEQRAQQQATTAVRRPLDQLQERDTAYSIFTPTGVSGPPGDPEVQRVRNAADNTATTVGAMTAIPGAVGSIAERGVMGAAKRAIKPVVRGAAESVAGAYGGGKAGGYLFGPGGEKAGKLIGALAGGAHGFGSDAAEARAAEEVAAQEQEAGLSARLKAAEDARQQQLADQGKLETQYGQEQADAIKRRAQLARANVTPGTAAKESGYTPPVTRVPIRPTPPSPLTPEQVPGPDTPGRGNLLTPAARRGDPRAAQELMRRGRSIIYTPAEEYPGTRLEGTLSERLAAPPTIPTPEAAPAPPQGYTPSEKATSLSQRMTSRGPEFEAAQRQEMIDRYNGIRRNPNATAEDLAEAQARLRELGAVQQ